MTYHLAAFNEGARMGKIIDAGAADCPYVPPDLERRDAWMAGFSSTRPTVSPASDPAAVTAKHEDTSSGGKAKPEAIG